MASSSIVKTGTSLGLRSSICIANATTFVKVVTQHTRAVSDRRAGYPYDQG